MTGSSLHYSGWYVKNPALVFIFHPAGICPQNYPNTIIALNEGHLLMRKSGGADTQH